MKSNALGKNTSALEVLNISPHGVWLWVNSREYFLPYAQFPWFRKARIAEVYRVELVRGHHLYWPDLDVDLELASLERPEQYPLLYKE